MSDDTSSLQVPRTAVVAFCVAITSLVVFASLFPSSGAALFELVALCLIGAAVIASLVRVRPSYTLSAALVASVFSGNWHELGLPAKLPPDRILATAGVVAVLLNSRQDHRPRWKAIHTLMVAFLVYVTMTAIVSAHTFIVPSQYELLDSLGLFPFLLFFLAPAAFSTRRDRTILLTALLLLGAYLAFTALMESLGVHQLVYPKYILNAQYGDPASAGRVRGPFAAAVQDGFGLFACTVAAAIAIAVWKDWRPRVLAALVGVACAFSIVLTEQRSIYLATIVATVTTLLLVRHLRRWLVPGLLVAALGIAAGIQLIPGLSQNLQGRLSDAVPVWERLNMNTAAENMVKAKPLFGFGWGTFAKDSQPYFHQSSDYPLVYTSIVHNVYLKLASEVGLIGVAAWLLIVFVGIGGGLRAPPHGLEPWRYGLLAYATCYLIVIAFVPPPTGFPSLFLWLLAGIMCSRAPSTSEDSAS